MKAIYVILSLLMCVGSIKAGDGVPMNAQFLLSKKEQATLMSKVKQGDSEAALRLYMYYTWGMDDQIEAFFWLRTAAELKNPKAEHCLASFYAEDRPITVFNPTSAKMWLKRAKKHGDATAEKELKELETKK